MYGCCMSLYASCVYKALKMPEEGVRSPRTEAMDSCEPPCLCPLEGTMAQVS